MLSYFVYVIFLQNVVEIVKHLNQPIGNCFYLIHGHSNLGMKLR